jgi:iron complex outermembrane receptor protein
MPKFLAVSRLRAFLSFRLCGRGVKTLALASCLTAAGAWSQDQAQTASNQPANPTNPTPAQAKPPTLTTTITVHGDIKDDYLPEALTVGTLDGAPLREAPLSATVVTRDLLSDQVSRVLSDVVKNDASVGEDYAPVGYYGDYEIRGFPIDLATGLEINGLTIAGEQDVPLENKQSVEFLKGVAGVESGVASAGGLIDYVTKRPVVIKALDLATDHRGSAYGAVDLGRLFGSQKQVGTRLNLAGERMQSYVNGADGWRAMMAGAADWKISPKATLKNDLEFQHKVERSVCGYQLLGGDAVPSMSLVHPSTMLGFQSWERPNTFDTFNAGTRLDYDLGPSWKAFAAGSYSHSLIDDNVVYAYGCYYEADCNTGSAPEPWFFAPDGTYDIYDYRNPGERRIDAEGEAMATGRVKTGAISQDLAAGGELFVRSVQQPGFNTVAEPYASNGVVQDGAVYTYVGSENIYQPIAPVDLATAEAPFEAAGPSRLWEDSHQAAAIVQDRVHLPGRVQLIAGGRFDSLHDHNYSAYASCSDFSIPGNCDPQLTSKLVWLPTYAATFNPIDKLTLYGNYGVLLSLGPQGPFWTDNGSQFLAPFFSRQVEVGAKFEPSQRILLTSAIYRMRSPFFYPKILAGPDSFCPSGVAGDQCFESEGRETHDGIEFSAEGKAANWLRLTASLAAISGISTNTGTPAFDNKQVINLPRVRTTFFADLAVPHVRGLSLMPGWGYTDSKEATRDDAVRVGGYNLFNLGARYTPGGEQGHVTVRIYADNITDKRYWKDTGANYGDTFIHLGAPTTVRLSAHYTF